MDIEEIKIKALPILQKAGVTRSAVFGSVARGEMTLDSDIDMLIEIPDDKSLFDFIDIKLELEQALGKKVDLVEYDLVKPALKDSILQTQVPIL